LNILLLLNDYLPTRNQVTGLYIWLLFVRVIDMDLFIATDGIIDVIMEVIER
jgi:hypothetical protein